MQAHHIDKELHAPDEQLKVTGQRLFPMKTKRNITTLVYYTTLDILILPYQKNSILAFSFCMLSPTP